MMSVNMAPQREVVENRELDLLRLLSALIEHRVFIIGMTTLFAMCALAYVTLVTPVYMADAMIQVEQKQGNSLLKGIDELSLGGNLSPDAAAEMQLLKSRMVLGKTVSDLNLHFITEQELFPVVGKGWARLTGQEPVTLALKALTLPKNNDSCSSLTLTVGQNGLFTIECGNIVAQGQVGKRLEKSGVVILVSEMKALPGTRFEVKNVTELHAINELNQRLTVRETSKNSGILILTLSGPDPDLNTAILNSITTNYLEQNIKRKAAQDSQSLVFLNNHLPLVRSELAFAEERLNEYRKKQDSVDLNLEAKSILEQIVNIQNKLNELTFREAEIAQLYKKDHPTYRALNEKRLRLEQEQHRLNERVTAMPGTQQEIIRLSRDVDSGRAIYLQLLTRQQELNISKSSVTGNVRIIDPAVTQPRPVSPQKGIIVMIGVLLGLLLSSFIICLRLLFNKGINSSEQLEEQGINVYATLPHSEWLKKETRQNKKPLFSVSGKHNVAKTPFIPLSRPMDLFNEAIRGLRTSLHFAMMDADNNILMFSGPTKGCGKSVVSTSLAAIVAQAGQKVLFIDADMRMGYTHQLFKLNNDGGLSALLCGKITAEESIQHFVAGGFDVLTCGQTPPNPSELLMQDRFQQLMQWANAHYDMVIVDTPPVLAVTDASLVGRFCASTFLVARFGITSTKEVLVCARRLQQAGVTVKGAILNDVMKRAVDIYGDDSGYYAYYERKTTPTAAKTEAE